MQHINVKWSPWHEPVVWLTLNVCHSYQKATDQFIAVLYFHGINILFDVYPKKYQVGWGQENVEASQLDIYCQSICPEIGCSTNYTLNMKSEEEHNRAEVTYPHKY
jgi:hypothetical protein